MYKAIIFDFFDVIRSDPYKAWLASHGIERKGEFVKLSHSLDRGDIDVEEFFQGLHKLSGHPVESVVKEYDNTTLMDEGMVDVITSLGQNYKVGLLSNAPSKYLRTMLRKHGYAPLFDEIVISSEVKLIKPTPEAFHHILQKLNTMPEEAIFIDDYDYNVEAANKVGITGIQYTTLQKLKNDLRKFSIKA